MQFIALYSSNGKQIFPKNGMLVQEGTMLLNLQRKFITLEKSYKYIKRSEWNNLCQTKEVTEELIEL